MKSGSYCRVVLPLIAPILVVVACGARTDLADVARLQRDDGGVRPALDARSEASGDASPGDSARPDVGTDAEHDARRDARHDVGTDAARHDARPDVGTDAAHDARRDARRDTGPDATPPSVAGCADGDREGFVDIATYPSIAGCSGGWSIPGVMPFDPGHAPACPTIPTYDTVDPACGRMAGNDGPNPDGTGCNVADLCASGWHVCTSSADVASHSPSGCTGATLAGAPSLFFATRQSSTGFNSCATGTATGTDCTAESGNPDCAETAETSNDVFGCGNFGSAGPGTSCVPLDRSTDNECAQLTGSTWSCTDDGSGSCEAYVLVHAGPTYGGVLCCQD